VKVCLDIGIHARSSIIVNMYKVTADGKAKPSSSEEGKVDDEVALEDESEEEGEGDGIHSEEQEKENQKRAEKAVEDFLKKETDEISKMDHNGDDLKQDREVGLATVKRIMKLNEKVKMVSAEAPVVLSKAAELILGEMAIRAYHECKNTRRKTIKKKDVASGVKKSDMFDFLIDIIHDTVAPNNSMYEKINKRGGIGAYDGVNTMFWTHENMIEQMRAYQMFLQSGRQYDETDEEERKKWEKTQKEMWAAYNRAVSHSTGIQYIQADRLAPNSHSQPKTGKKTEKC